MPMTSEVFGLSVRVTDYSYIDRNQLDKRLRRLLKRDTHIAIKGPSKCGKSWLRQKCMLNNEIVVQCRLGMTVEDIYRQALSILGVPFDIHTSATTTMAGSLEGSGTARVPIIAKAQLGAKGSFEYEKTAGSELDFSNSIENLGFIADKVNASNKKLVIEDFHYLDMNQRKRLAHD